VFVIPFITMLVVLLIDMTLYMRDVFVAGSLADRVAEETRSLVLDDEDPGTGRIRYERKLERSIFARWFKGTEAEDAVEMTERLRKLSADRFWSCRVEDALVCVNGDVVSVQLRLRGNTVAPMLGNMSTGQWFSGRIVRECSCRNPRTRVRCYAAVIDTGSQVVGVKTVFEKLGAIVKRFH